MNKVYFSTPCMHIDCFTTRGSLASQFYKGFVEHVLSYFLYNATYEGITLSTTGTTTWLSNRTFIAGHSADFMPSRGSLSFLQFKEIYFQTCCDPPPSVCLFLKHNLQHFAFADSLTRSSKLIQSAAHRKKKALPQPSP